MHEGSLVRVVKGEVGNYLVEYLLQTESGMSGASVFPAEGDEYGRKSPICVHVGSA